jgi:hypothetical protein
MGNGVGAAAAGIIAAIGGDEAQRQAAYEQLAALARGDNAEVAATIAAASLHIDGLDVADELQDEASRKLREASLAGLFGTFGTVLTVTLGDENADALLTFGEVAEAQKAVQDLQDGGGAASLGVSGLVVRIFDTQRASGAMGELIQQHRERVVVSVAVACVGPLVETVFAADISVVSATEFQRAASVLAELFLLDILLVGAEYWAPVTCDQSNIRPAISWKTPGTAYATVRPRSPARHREHVGVRRPTRPPRPSGPRRRTTAFCHTWPRAPRCAPSAAGDNPPTRLVPRLISFALLTLRSS